MYLNVPVINSTTVQVLQDLISMHKRLQSARFWQPGRGRDAHVAQLLCLSPALIGREGPTVRSFLAPVQVQRHAIHPRGGVTPTLGAVRDVRLCVMCDGVCLCLLNKFKNTLYLPSVISLC